MTLAQRIAQDDSRWVMAMALSTLLLFGVIAVLVFVGVHPAQASAPQAASSPLANPSPACASALARARDTRGMSADDAVAVSVAMLRACQVR